MMANSAGMRAGERCRTTGCMRRRAIATALLAAHGLLLKTGGTQGACTNAAPQKWQTSQAEPANALFHDLYQGASRANLQATPPPLARMHHGLLLGAPKRLQWFAFGPERYLFVRDRDGGTLRFDDLRVLLNGETTKSAANDFVALRIPVRIPTGRRFVGFRSTIRARITKQAETRVSICLQVGDSGN